MSTIYYGQFQSESAILLRETEQENLRITENGDFRETFEIKGNLAESFLIAESIKLPFVTSVYIKDKGLWKNLIPFVKYLNEWKSVNTIYIKQNNEWKRVY
jgi:hypothetical protein